MDTSKSCGFIISPRRVNVVYERAIKNIHHLLRLETDCSKERESIEPALPTLFLQHLNGADQNMADGTKLLLDRLNQITTGSSDALDRYLFSAATSEILNSGRSIPTLSSHFLFLATVELHPFLAELARTTDDEWEGNSRNKIPVQRETKSIAIFVRASKNVDRRHDQYVKPSSNALKYPHLTNWLQNFSSTVGNGILQLARIVKLQPHGTVYPHIDRGLYYLIRDRYHLVLESQSGSKMACENQVSLWRPGQVWWFNNHVVHEASNDSEADRIHVIFDILPHRNQILVPFFHKYASGLED